MQSREIDPDVVKKSYEDGWVEINGITYTMLKLSNEVALDIVGLSQVCAGAGARINDNNWKELQKKIYNAFSVDGQLLSRIPGHFEEHRGSYFTFLSYAIAMVSYPFI